jgi:hypothetical protein
MYDISILVDTHSTKQREKQWQHEWGYISRFGSHSSANNLLKKSGLSSLGPYVATNVIL